MIFGIQSLLQILTLLDIQCTKLHDLRIQTCDFLAEPQYLLLAPEKRHIPINGRRNRLLHSSGIRGIPRLFGNESRLFLPLR